VKTTPWLAALTVVNLAILAHHALREARAEEAPGVLRGRGLEIVDGEGRLRAQIEVEPADPAYRWPDGKRVGYPETVILRLVTADGKPRVKVTTSADGSGLMLLGSEDATRVQAIAEGRSTVLRLRNDEGAERVLRP
jgi:hypothetical protein